MQSNLTFPDLKIYTIRYISTMPALPPVAVVVIIRAKGKVW
jgi:hypothetical protein